VEFGDARLPARFWTKVQVNEDTGCWEWTGHLSFGYGYFRTAGAVENPKRAHRVAYEALIGRIPLDLEIDHQCRVRNCVNPKHLEAVTRSLNVRRGIAADGSRRRAAAITHCPAGHEYAGENLYVTSRGHRSCQECRRLRQRAEDPTPRGAHHSAKTHCPQGHPHSGENLYLTSRGGRACVTCRRSRSFAKAR
jgi:hypothetical protein